jgi:Ni,Fe-hydrogenase maturation factor
MKILCFGNPFLEEDNLAIEIGKELRIPGAEFLICENIDCLMQQDLESVVILDVVKGLQKAQLFDDIDSFDTKKLFSLHDFDVCFVLKLLKEVGKAKKINILGIPQQGNKQEIKKEVTRIINGITTKTT